MSTADTPLAPPPPGFPSWLSQDVSLLDGRSVFIRAVLPSDADELRRAVEQADPESLRSRFLGARPPQGNQEFERLVRVDYTRRLAVLAFAADGHGVGIARYEALGNGDTADVAVAVDPGWRHIGLATTLVQLLATCAERNDIRQFTADFFADNLDVIDLIAETGMPYQNTDATAGVIVATVTLPADPAISP